MSWRARSRTQAPDALWIGRRADGDDLLLPLGWHTLIAGLSGSGKSTTLRALLTSAAPIRDLSIVFIDIKRVECRPWRPRTATTATTIPEVVQLLAGLLDEMDRRAELLERRGLVDWDTGLGPRVLVIVDELASLVATGTPNDKTITKLIRQLLERGRYVGYTLVLATQRPSHDVIPTSIRDLCALRIAHATANIESTRMILAEAAEHGPAHEIPVDDEHRGRCWVIVDGTRHPVEARSGWVTADTATDIARRTASLNVPWRSTLVDPYVYRTGALARAGVQPHPATGPDPTPPAPVLPLPPSLPHPATIGAPGLPPVTVLTADDSLWLHLLDHELGSRAPSWRARRGQPDEVGAAARREAPQPAAAVGPVTEPGTLPLGLSADELAVLTALRSSADGLPAAAIVKAARLPEGRARRARQALERRHLVAPAGSHWVALA